MRKLDKLRVVSLNKEEKTFVTADGIIHEFCLDVISEQEIENLTVEIMNKGAFEMVKRLGLEEEFK